MIIDSSDNNNNNSNGYVPIRGEKYLVAIIQNMNIEATHRAKQAVIDETAGLETEPAPGRRLLLSRLVEHISEPTSLSMARITCLRWPPVVRRSPPETSVMD